MRRLALPFACLLLLAAPAAASAECANADLQPTADRLDDIAAATFCLHNEERAKAGLLPLRWSDQLAEAARDHSLDMVTNEFFSHLNLEDLRAADRIEATGYEPASSAENIATGTGSGYTAREAMEGWMNSDEGHRENILRPLFQHLGVGVAFGGLETLEEDESTWRAETPGATYTANFGSRSLPDDETIGDGPGLGYGDEPEPGPDLEDEGDGGGFEEDESDGPDRPITPDDPVTGDKPTKAEKRKKKLKACLKKANKNKKKSKKRKKRKRCRNLYG